MQTIVTSKAYSSRSNARRAAGKAGITKFDVVEIEGGFAYQFEQEMPRDGEGRPVQLAIVTEQVVEKETEQQTKPATNNALAGLVAQATIADTESKTKPAGKPKNDQPMQNGVKRPKDGGKCAAVWNELDKIAAQRNPTMADVKKLAADNNWNATNASCEFYAWRKFNGINKSNAGK